MDDEAARRPGPDVYQNLRKVSDARELRALAHPVRMALYEALALNQSLTATQASKLVGGSPSSVAYHLRTLAKYGYVEETNDGTGRERPWRLSQIGYSFSENTTDPEANAAANALSRQLFKRWVERREEYQRTKDQYPEEVRKAVGNWNEVLFGTAEELTEIEEAFGRLFAKYRDRITDPRSRPEGWRIFELQLFTHPIDTSSLALAEEDGTGNDAETH